MLSSRTDTVHLFSRKGGQGCTVIAALLTVLLDRSHRPSTVYDAAPRGDLAAALGLHSADRFEISPNVTGYRLETLAHAQNLPAADVIDWGTNPIPDTLPGHRYLVTTACYLALRAAAHHPADGVVLLTEADRALSARDVTHSIGADVVATVPRDPAIARAVDAGLLVSRPCAAATRLADLLPALDVEARS